MTTAIPQTIPAMTQALSRDFALSQTQSGQLRDALLDAAARCLARDIDQSRFLGLVWDLRACYLQSRGPGYQPRVTDWTAGDGTRVFCIEPAVGCTVHLIHRPGAVLFVDAGCACFETELMALARRLIPDLDACRLEQLITHGDIDHVGVFAPFRRIYLSGVVYRSFVSQLSGGPCTRETIPYCLPIYTLNALLSGYRPPKKEQLVVISDQAADPADGLLDTGVFHWEGLDFLVFQGAGGHVDGELVLAEPRLRLALAGDLHVSGHNMTQPQRDFNAIINTFLGTADQRPQLAARERQLLYSPPGPGLWTVCCGHGGFAHWTMEPKGD